MAILFSKSTLGFYDTRLAYSALPDDVVEIPETLHHELLDAQSEGKLIVGDASGYPQVVDRE